MASSCRDLALAPGFTFRPPPNQLTDLYLRRKIAGQPLHDITGRFIHDVDIYSAEPEQLTKDHEKAPGTGDQPEWYFFSPVRYVGGRKKSARGGKGRRSRTIDGVVGKHWHSEASAKPVKGGSSFGGYEHKFSYMAKDKDSGQDVRAGWIMAEYGISDEHGGGDFVICNIHRAPRAGQDQAASATTAAVVPISGDPSISSNSKKRKAATEDTTPSARPRYTPAADQDDHPHPVLVEPDMPTSTGDQEFTFDATELDNFRPGMFDFDNVDLDFFNDIDLGMFNGIDRQPESIVVTEPPPCAAAAPPLAPSSDFFFDTAVAEVQEIDGAAPPLSPSSNFFFNVEQEFASLYHIDDAVMLGPEAAQPEVEVEEDVVLTEPTCTPAAQPEENAGTGLVEYSIMEDQHQHMDVRSREEGGAQAQPDFMIRRCSMMMPWPMSPTTTTMAAI